jgi:hypothetical protein
MAILILKRAAVPIVTRPQPKPDPLPPKKDEPDDPVTGK